MVLRLGRSLQVESSTAVFSSDILASGREESLITASILEWFAIPSSSGSRFVRTLCYNQSVLGGPTQHGS